MTKITLEVADNETVDCGYYGSDYLVVTKRIHMVKPNGNVQDVLDKLNIRFNAALALCLRYFDLQKQIKEHKSELISLANDIAKRRRRLNKAKQALREFDQSQKAQQLTDDQLTSEISRHSELKAELAQYEQAFENVDGQIDVKCEDEIIYVILLKIIPLEHNKPITLQNILDSVLGSTALYDALIDDGWSVDTQNDKCLNDLREDPEYANDETLLKTQYDTDVYYSKHQQL